MQISKERFTTIALGIVEVNQEYDRDAVIYEVAAQLAMELHETLGWGCLSMDCHEKLKEAFAQAAEKNIDWPRLNRKVWPDDYADSSWRMAEEIAQMRSDYE